MGAFPRFVYVKGVYCLGFYWTSGRRRSVFSVKADGITMTLPQKTVAAMPAEICTPRGATIRQIRRAPLLIKGCSEKAKWFR